MSTKITARNYNLRTENGSWLGQVVLTSDGAFMALTDWGNFNFAWRSHGEEDFRKFIIRVEVDYFASKMYQGMQYIAHGKKIQEACDRFAKNILPTLKKVLKEEIEKEISDPNYRIELQE